MLEEITQLFNVQVFTNRGVVVGTVDNVIIDTNTHQIEGIVIETTNESLVEGGRSVNIPMRWIQAVGDIIITKHFPERITMSPEEKQMWEQRQMEQEEE